MSIKSKIYKSARMVEAIDGRKIVGTDTVTKQRLEMVPIVLIYEEGNVTSGIMVGVRPDDVDFVMTALNKMHGVADSGDIIDSLLGTNKIIMRDSGLIIPGKNN